VFIAGDDETAKAKVSDLAKTAEFEPIDSGPLYNSRFLEPMGEMNILLGFFLARPCSLNTLPAGRTGLAPGFP
jgi:predicted dinucleotide-binding enzyme